MSAENREDPAPERSIESFLGEPTQDLDDWRWLWDGDHPFPVRSHRPGLAGRVVAAIKRFFRPLVRAPQADLWDRQKTYNQVVLSHLENLHGSVGQLGSDLSRDLRQVREEILRDLRSVQSELVSDSADLVERIEALEEFKREGMKDLMLHTDALFTRLDQKLDRVRRKAERLAEMAELAELAEPADAES